jgi:tight adherence protein C
MIDVVISKLSDAHLLGVLFASMGFFATVLMMLLPLIQSNNLNRRIKSVTSERERIRLRERERLAVAKNKTQVRHRTGGITKRLSEALNLTKWLSTDTAKQQLARAGFRGASAEYVFLTFRFATPIVFFLFATIYFLLITKVDLSFAIKVGVSILAAFIGLKTPEVFLRNTTTKRQKSMSRAYPNMVDLLIICAESGMSIEHAVRRVGLEIGAESIALAEELSLLAAEVSYLEQRRTAFENFNERTGLESIRQLTTVLVQSEKYGTPLGGALRVLAQESRDQRMTAAEKKAASLPPTLTVPMIVFFLPGLFAAILGPAAIQINHWT